MKKCKDCNKEISKKATRCRSCSKKRNLNGFKNGLPLCLDCKVQLSDYRAKRCPSCAGKQWSIQIKKLLKDPRNHPMFKTGETLKKHYCKICGKEVSICSALYGLCLCLSCSKTGENNTNFGKKRPEQSKFMTENNPFKGKHHTEKIKSKLSLSHGGTGVPYEDNEYSQEFRNIRESIRDRDNHKCQCCHKIEEELNETLAVHHIDYNKQNCEDTNLISLCNSCHSKTNTNRDYWFAYFTEIINSIYQLL